MKSLTDDYWELHKLGKEFSEIRIEYPRQQSRQLNLSWNFTSVYIHNVEKKFKFYKYKLIDIQK